MTVRHLGHATRRMAATGLAAAAAVGCDRATVPDGARLRGAGLTGCRLGRGDWPPGGPAGAARPATATAVSGPCAETLGKSSGRKPAGNSPVVAYQYRVARMQAPRLMANEKARTARTSVTMNVVSQSTSPPKAPLTASSRMTRVKSDKRSHVPKKTSPVPTRAPDQVLRTLRQAERKAAVGPARSYTTMGSMRYVTAVSANRNARLSK